jgi:predicted MPP superfamily phosphohydrolase
VRPRRPERPAAAALGAALGAAALGAYALLVEPRRLRVRRAELRLDRWPRVYDGFRLALVSDLHAGTPHVGVDRVRRVAELVDREGPDLVALLGDYVDDHAAFAEYVRPQEVAEVLARISAPLGRVAVLGNHDWRTGGERIRTALRDAGIAVLEDEALELRSARVPLWVAGLADATERSPDVPAALAGVPAEAALIVLSHDPDLFPRVPARAALTVSGHTHGGQVDLPVARRRVVPSRFGDRYAAGHVEEGGRHLFVTRGVGTSAWPVRFRATPEVVVLTLRPKA